MEERDLESRAFAFYVEELRRGSADPYIAYRICEKSWKLARSDAALLRRAAICLIETDPWFLATAAPYYLHVLGTSDLERLTPFVGAGPARKFAVMLRAMLWYHGRRGPFHPDRAGRAQLRRALGFLQKVPSKQRDHTWHEMLVGCYRVLDYDEYKRAFKKLLHVTSPNRRAYALHTFLNMVAAKKDWNAYDVYRREWDQLAPGHHACECYTNDVYTNDGLRAAAAGKWSAIPEALARASAVRGCPHLNTGGLRLDLVRLVVSKRKHLEEARAYLNRAAGFEAHGKDMAVLRRRFDAVAG
jgi:hypothetical protein